MIMMSTEFFARYMTILNQCLALIPTKTLTENNIVSFAIFIENSTFLR